MIKSKIIDFFLKEEGLW